MEGEIDRLVERRVMEVKKHQEGGRVEVRIEKLKWLIRSPPPSSLITLLLYSLFLPLTCPLLILPPVLLSLPSSPSSYHCSISLSSFLLSCDMETKSRQKVQMMLERCKKEINTCKTGLQVMF